MEGTTTPEEMEKDNPDLTRGEEKNDLWENFEKKIIESKTIRSIKKNEILYVKIPAKQHITGEKREVLVALEDLRNIYVELIGE